MNEAEPHPTSYEKIVERPEQWGLDDTGYRALKKSSWVVTEKIHGANFALLSDGQEVRGRQPLRSRTRVYVYEMISNITPSRMKVRIR